MKNMGGEGFRCRILSKNAVIDDEAEPDSSQK
jgi:hypothetical protein